jgi:hypothetical protein
MSKAQWLRRDEQGAVVLIGLFMSLVLVGLLHYMMSVGDSIVARQNVQDGADATAYAAAVYHARGMNVIAMLNLIMAAVLAVLVALKVFQVLLVAANILSCLLIPVPIFGQAVAAPVCEATANVEPRLEQLILRVSDTVPKVLKGLSIAEKGVAVGMPWVAEAKSFTIAGDYRPMELGMVASVSMIPAAMLEGTWTSGTKAAPEHYLLCKNTPQDGFVSGRDTEDRYGKSVVGSSCRYEGNHRGCCGGKGGHGGIDLSQPGPEVPSDKRILSKPTKGKFASGPGRVGLPVEPDDFLRLCDAAGKVVADLVLLPLTIGPLAGVSGHFRQIASNVLGNIVKTVPAYFCGGSPQDEANALNDLQGQICADAQNQAQSNQPSTNSSDSSGQSSGNAGPSCQALASSGLQIGSLSKPGPTPKEPPTGSGSTQSKKAPAKPAAVPAGNDAAKAAEADTAAKGAVKDTSSETPMKVYDPATFGSDFYAIWSFASTDSPQLGTKADWFFAEADFYYDRGNGEFSFNNDGTQNFPDDAMWNMRWRARLRRLRAPIPDVVKTAEAVIKAKSKKGSHSAFTALVDTALTSDQTNFGMVH